MLEVWELFKEIRLDSSSESSKVVLLCVFLWNMDYLPLVSFSGCKDMSLVGVLCHSPSRQKFPVCFWKFSFFIWLMIPGLLLLRIEIMVNCDSISVFILDTTLLVVSCPCSFKSCSPWQVSSGLQWNPLCWK